MSRVCRPRSHFNLKLACRGGMFSQERSFDEVRILLQIKIIYTGDSLTLGLRYPVTLTKCPEVLLQMSIVVSARPAMSDNRLISDRKDNTRSVLHFEQLDFSLLRTLT